MKRPEPIPEGDPSSTSFPDATWAKSMPHVCEYLHDDRWEDGKPREVSTIVIKEEDGRVVVALNDKDLSRSLYRSGETVAEALKALEKALATQSADWRKWFSGPKKKAAK